MEQKKHGASHQMIVLGSGARLIEHIFFGLQGSIWKILQGGFAIFLLQVLHMMSPSNSGSLVFLIRKSCEVSQKKRI